MTQTDNSCTFIFLRNWKGELVRARCKHCALLLPLLPAKRRLSDGGFEVVDRSNFAGHCKYWNCIKPRISFACDHFQNKESFKLESSVIQTSLF